MIAGTFDIPTMTHLGTYLGTPIFIAHRTTDAYQYLIDKIQKKIEGWQIKYLLVARRATLIKSTSTLFQYMPCKQPFSLKKLIGIWIE